MDYEELVAKREGLQHQIIIVEKEMLKFGDPARQILAFLNEKTGKKYRPVAANLNMIRARIKEGYSVDELRQVVAMMCRKWGRDEKMCGYLRP